MASFISPKLEAIQIVLENCSHLHYLSYTQTQETRTIQDNPEKIFNQIFMIQGIEKRTDNQYILYCSTCQDKIEAGELHFTATSYKLYDQEFGQLTFEDFCKAAE